LQVVVNISRGFKIEPVPWNLNLPSIIAFDEKGNMYIAEAGYAPGELETTPRILKVDQNGAISSFVDRKLYGPITDITYREVMLYVANRGKISSIDIRNVQVEDKIMALPSLGGPSYRTNSSWSIRWKIVLWYWKRN
jgi:hypothetical protein